MYRAHLDVALIKQHSDLEKAGHHPHYPQAALSGLTYCQQHVELQPTRVPLCPVSIYNAQSGRPFWNSSASYEKLKPTIFQ